MTPGSIEQMRELLRALAAAQSLDLDDRLAALEERIVGRLAKAVVDELDRRGWTAAAPPATEVECPDCLGTGRHAGGHYHGAERDETCWPCGGSGVRSPA